MEDKLIGKKGKEKWYPIYSPHIIIGTNKSILDSMKEHFVEIETACVCCGKIFNTLLEIKTGDVDNIFCSEECGVQYYEDKKFLEDEESN